MRGEVAALMGAWVLSLSGCPKPDCEMHPPEPAADLGALTPPAGFAARTVLTGLSQPTQLQFDTTGRLFVLEGGPEGPKALRVFSADFQRAGGVPIDTAGESTGLLVFGAGERVLVGSRGRVDLLEGSAAGGYGPLTPWLTGLPAGPEHTNNGLTLGPDDFVYFGAGSSCDVCDEPNALAATVLRAPASQSAPAVEVFARGLRNSYDVTFTIAGDLLATDNGPECCGGQSKGCEGPGPDRLVEVKQGATLGWPDAFRGRALLPEPLLRLPVHGGATGFTVARATGCDEVLYLTLWGTEQSATETGRKVLRATLSRNAQGQLMASDPIEVLGPSGLAHPIDVTQGPDGALYVLDFGGSVVRLESLTGCP